MKNVRITTFLRHFEKERWLSNPDPEIQRAARALLLGKAI